MIKIEKKIPLPEFEAEKYPFGKMQIGDSFFWEGERNTLATSAAWYGKRNKKKFSVRKEKEGHRCWRIE